MNKFCVECGDYGVHYGVLCDNCITKHFHGKDIGVEQRKIQKELDLLFKSLQKKKPANLTSASKFRIDGAVNIPVFMQRNMKLVRGETRFTVEMDKPNDRFIFTKKK